MINKTISIYYEPPKVSERYFDTILKRIKRIYPIYNIHKYPISNISALKLSIITHHPRVILTYKDIHSKFNEKLLFDGISLIPNNVTLVKYQSTSFFDTYYLLLHEIGHLFGLPHCINKSCIMGVIQKENKINYVWRKLSKRKVLTKRSLLCSYCKAVLQRFAIATDAGG